MLVLSRKKNEVVRINDDISIVIVEIRSDKVRIGVDAPANVPVHRGEVYDAIQRENRQATMKALETTDLTAPAEGGKGDA